MNNQTMGLLLGSAVTFAASVWGGAQGFAWIPNGAMLAASIGAFGFGLYSYLTER
ncbi:MAG: hypothetical protein NT157_05295 [Candidatus Micrarchaeota archaeon]|nr:hypothetical protein [Candidatus Micrarchaeota archaeon]